MKEIEYHSILRWKLKWGTFVYNYGWSRYVFMFDGWIAKCAMAVPVIGYLIIFNDSISQHLSFNKLANEDALRFGLSAIARLKLIYFGLIFLGSANILYRIRRPYVLRIGTNRFDYVEKALTHFTVSDYIDIDGEIRHYGHHTLHGKYYDSDFGAFVDLALGKSGAAGNQGSSANWLTAKNKYEGLLRSILIENFFRNNIRRRVSLSFCIILSFVGYMLLLIPSADLFIKVLRVVLR